MDFKQWHKGDELIMRVGRKRKFPYEKLLEALEYCVAYCDDHDDCEECMFKDVRIDMQTECPIYVITNLRDAVKEEIEYEHANE